MTTTRRIYLDYNASAPLLREAREAMCAALDVMGNPSSVHAEGRKARGVIEAAREDVARLVNARVSEVVFTSGATEANATVVGAGFCAIAAPGVEHSSVLGPLPASGSRLLALPVDADGRVEPERVAKLLQKVEAGRRLVALQLANNETGVIQPVTDVAALAHEQGWLLHTDAVQAPGRIGVDFATLGADTLALSAHKLGGPKGIGALVVRDGVEIKPLIGGGGQERRRRAGTENVAAIAGFGAAARIAWQRAGAVDGVRKLRDRLEAGVREITPDALIVGAGAKRVPNTTCLVRDGQNSEIAVIKLDVAGFAISAGSACSSGKVGASHVLEALGLAPHLARSGLRISIGHETTPGEIEAFIEAWRNLHAASQPKVRGAAATTRNRPAAAVGMGE